MDASICSIPLAFRASAKKPPPPKVATVTRNGLWRSETAKRTLAGLSTNGSERLALRLTFWMLKMPTPTVGRARA